MRWDDVWPFLCLTRAVERGVREKVWGYAVFEGLAGGSVVVVIIALLYGSTRVLPAFFGREAVHHVDLVCRGAYGYLVVFSVSYGY